MPIHLDLHNASAWFRLSLSRALHTLSQKAQPALPPDVCAALDKAAGCVYFHESCITDMQAIGLGTDHSFVYSGYRSAVDNLLVTITLPGFEGTTRAGICRDITSYLNNILTVIQEKGGNVPKLFTDTDMLNLLYGLSCLL